MAGRVGYRAAALLLAERDPVLARLVADAGLPRVPVVRETHFATLVRSIVYQQLATAAARAIHGRLIAALADDVTPERVLATAPELLRAAGLSGRKVESLRDLATKVLDGTVILDPRRLGRLSDEEVTARLVTVRGIGKWSADIFLMFRLRRMDVWPTGDLAVRKGFALAWAVPEPAEKQLIPLGEPYRPYRSVVAWYCWRAVELYGRTSREPAREYRRRGVTGGRVVSSRTVGPPAPNARGAGPPGRQRRRPGCEVAGRRSG